MRLLLSYWTQGSLITEGNFICIQMDKCTEICFCMFSMVFQQSHATLCLIISLKLIWELAFLGGYLIWHWLQDGYRIKKYRGMGSLEAMTKGSDQRYLGDTAKLKIAQGVVGAVVDKGSILRLLPYTMQAVKQGFQDLGATSLQSAHDLLRSKTLRLEVWPTWCYYAVAIRLFCWLFVHMHYEISVVLYLNLDLYVLLRIMASLHFSFWSLKNGGKKSSKEFDWMSLTQSLYKSTKGHNHVTIFASIKIINADFPP